MGTSAAEEIVEIIKSWTLFFAQSTFQITRRLYQFHIGIWIEAAFTTVKIMGIVWMSAEKSMSVVQVIANMNSYKDGHQKALKLKQKVGVTNTHEIQH